MFAREERGHSIKGYKRRLDPLFKRDNKHTKVMLLVIYTSRRPMYFPSVSDSQKFSYYSTFLRQIPLQNTDCQEMIVKRMPTQERKLK